MNAGEIAGIIILYFATGLFTLAALSTARQNNKVLRIHVLLGIPFIIHYIVYFSMIWLMQPLNKDETEEN